MSIFEQFDGNSYLYGMRLIATTFITKKIPRRKHRKKRINKKWLKRYGYREVPDYGRVAIANGCILAQPKTIEWLIESVKNYDR